MKHIVIVSTSYPLSADGQEAAGTFVADFAEQLSSHARVTVIAPALQQVDVKMNENFEVRYFPVPTLPLSLLNAANPKSWLPIMTTLYRGRKALQKIVRQQQIDFIFALWVLPSGYWARAIAQDNHIPYATWALGSDIWSLSRLPIIRSVLRQVLADSRINFADGLQLANDVQEISGKECRFLPSTRQLAVCPEKVLAVNAPYNLVFLGRWHTNKGIDILLESLALLDEKDWQRIHQIRIAGGGPMEPMVKAACAKLQSDGRPVELLGYLNKTQATDLIVAADYVLIPSRVESIPVIFSDAMKCGSPVIAMPVGDLPLLLQQYRAGVLSEDVTAEDFAFAIQQALTKPCEEFRSGLQQASEKFDVQTIVRDFLKAVV
ncbi:MAG: glycosyltransferase [Gammaproteobacteria bacterium]|nr:glycosyltransferase [Gammaproteobacteria bacterium]MBU2177859.1 glycosyltransferase [Gammaproteobacteria bacterium]